MVVVSAAAATYDPTMVRVQITSMQPTESDGSVVAQVTLAQGLSQRNYSNTVNVCVRDTMGAQNCTEIETIQVRDSPGVRQPRRGTVQV